MTPDPSQPDAGQSATTPGRQASPDGDSAARISSLTGPSYITVCPAAIRGGEPLDFTLFRKSADGKLTPFKPAGSTLSDAERAPWAAADSAASAATAADSNIASPADLLYVTGEEYDRYHARAESALAAVLADESLGEARFALSYRLTVQLLQELLNRPAEGLLVRTIKLVDVLVTHVQQHAADLAPLMSQRPAGYETAEHMAHVGLLALLAAGELTLPPQDWSPLVRAAILHDLGKAQMPEALLRKEGRLTQGEWMLYREHPARGARWLRQLLGDAPGVALLADLTLSHHETVNGHGFPQGLDGPAIHPWATLISVLDTYDLLVTPRPFRDALSPQEARAVLHAAAGVRFDEQAVAMIARVIAENRLGTSSASGADPAAAASAESSSAETAGLTKPAGNAALPLESFLPLPPASEPVTHSHSRGPVQRAATSNRRKFARQAFSTSCRVQFLRPGAAPEAHIGFWVQAMDLSRSGMQFTHVAPIRPGEILSIFLPTTADQGRRVNAMVVRCIRGQNNQYAIGCRFDYR